MMNNIKTNTQPEKVVAYIRDGLVEQEHYGFAVRGDRTRELEKIGDDRNYPFYLRSCAKPLQATLLIDYDMDEKYNMSEEEIAICCASHAGEKVHTDLVRELLNKFGIPENCLKCGIHSPLSLSARKELIRNNEDVTLIHNNCSGKHTMMLGICKDKCWDLEDYNRIDHPLQVAIKQKVYELCDVKAEYPVTKDGCGVPIFSMPLLNIVKGYLNVFCNPKYEKIKNAFLNHPYIIGGEDRTDTKIMTQGDGLVAKVGASGLCVVVNTKLEEGFVVKICDSNMEAREILTCDLINNIHWGEIETCHDVKTLHDEKIGEIISLI